jgi:hypothetical protein
MLLQVLLQVEAPLMPGMLRSSTSTPGVRPVGGEEAARVGGTLGAKLVRAHRRRGALGVDASSTM